MLNGDGVVKVAEPDAVHPSSSVMVTEYVPAPKLDRLALVEVVFHRYVNGLLPTTFVTIVPVFPALHNGCVGDKVTVLPANMVMQLGQL